MNEMYVLDDLTGCAEVIFEYEKESAEHVPFQRLFFGNIQELTNILNGEVLEKMKKEAGADNVFVQNIYFRAKEKNDLMYRHRTEIRIGNKDDVYDMEGFVLKEEKTWLR